MVASTIRSKHSAPHHSSWSTAPTVDKDQDLSRGKSDDTLSDASDDEEESNRRHRSALSSANRINPSILLKTKDGERLSNFESTLLTYPNQLNNTDKPMALSDNYHSSALSSLNNINHSTHTAHGQSGSRLRGQPMQSSKLNSNSIVMDRSYCICRKGYDGVEFMIGCDGCEEWFHGSCIGLNPQDATQVTTYYCPSCSEANRIVTRDAALSSLSKLRSLSDTETEDELESNGTHDSEDSFSQASSIPSSNALVQMSEHDSGNERDGEETETESESERFESTMVESDEDGAQAELEEDEDRLSSASGDWKNQSVFSSGGKGKGMIRMNGGGGKGKAAYSHHPTNTSPSSSSSSSNESSSDDNSRSQKRNRGGKNIKIPEKQPRIEFLQHGEYSSGESDKEEREQMQSKRRHAGLGKGGKNFLTRGGKSESYTQRMLSQTKIEESDTTEEEDIGEQKETVKNAIKKEVGSPMSLLPSLSNELDAADDDICPICDFDCTCHLTANAAPTSPAAAPESEPTSPIVNSTPSSPKSTAAVQSEPNTKTAMVTPPQSAEGQSTQRKRPIGRPRKDGLPPGSVPTPYMTQKAKRQRQLQAAAQAKQASRKKKTVKSPELDSHVSTETEPLAKVEDLGVPVNRYTLRAVRQKSESIKEEDNWLDDHNEVRPETEENTKPNDMSTGGKVSGSSRRRKSDQSEPHTSSREDKKMLSTRNRRRSSESQRSKIPTVTRSGRRVKVKTPTSDTDPSPSDNESDTNSHVTSSSISTAPSHLHPTHPSYHCPSSSSELSDPDSDISELETKSVSSSRSLRIFPSDDESDMSELESSYISSSYLTSIHSPQSALNHINYDSSSSHSPTLSSTSSLHDQPSWYSSSNNVTKFDGWSSDDENSENEFGFEEEEEDDDDWNEFIKDSGLPSPFITAGRENATPGDKMKGKKVSFVQGVLKRTPIPKSVSVGGNNAADPILDQQTDIKVEPKHIDVPTSLNDFPSLYTLGSPSATTLPDITSVSAISTASSKLPTDSSLFPPTCSTSSSTNITASQSSSSSSRGKATQIPPSAAIPLLSQALAKLPKSLLNGSNSTKPTGNGSVTGNIQNLKRRDSDSLDKSQNPSKRSRKSSQLSKDTNSTSTSNSNSITSSVPPALSAAGAASFPYLSQYSYPGFPFPLPFLSFPGLFNIDLSNHMAGDATLNSVPSNPVNGKKKSAKSGKHLPELDEYEEFTGTLEGDDDDEILRLFDIVDVEVFGSTESEEEYLHRQHQNEFEEDTLDEESEDGYSSRRDGRRRSRRLSQGKRNRTLSNLSSVSSNGNGSRQKRLSSSRSNSASRYPSNPSHSGNETVSESQGSDNDRDSDCFSNSSTPRDMNYFGSSASESENDNDEKEKHGSKRSVGKRSAAILANRKIMAHAHTQQDQKVKAVGGPTWVVKDQNPELDQKHVRIGRSSVVQKRPVSDGDTELEDNDEHSDGSQEQTEASRKRKIGRVESALSVRRRKVSQGRWVEEDLMEHNGSNSNSRSRSRSRSRKFSIPRQQMKSNSASSSNSNSAPSRDPSLPFTSPKISRHLRALNRWSKIPIGTFRRSRRLSNPCPSVTQAVRTFGGVAVNTDVMIGGGNDGYDDNSDDSDGEDKFDNGFGEWDELALGMSKLDGPESESNQKREFTSPELTELQTMEITDDYTDFLDLFNIKSSNTQSALPSNSLSISHITQNPTPVSTPSPSVAPGRKPLASNNDNLYPNCDIPLSLPLSLPSSSLLSLGIEDSTNSGSGGVGYGVSLDKNLFEDLSLGTSFNIESEGYGMDDINLDLELDFDDEEVGSTTVDRWGDNWGWNVEVKREA